MPTRPEDRAMFLAVADESSFSAAAARLGVPISTLSRRMAALEVELRVELLTRTTRHVELTDAGREYATRLRPLLTELDDLEHGLAKGDALGSVLRVAAPAGLDRPFFGPAMAAFCGAHPEVELLWSSLSTTAHPLRDGFDIVITEQRIVDAELVARKVLSTREVCVAAPSYLATRGRPRNARELASHDLLALGCARTPVEWPLSGGGTVHIEPSMRCNDYGLLIEAAVHGLGITLVPLIMVRGHHDPAAVELVLDGVVGLRRDIHICYARAARRRRVVQAFVSFVLAYVKQVPVFNE